MVITNIIPDMFLDSGTPVVPPRTDTCISLGLLSLRPSDQRPAILAGMHEPRSMHFEGFSEIFGKNESCC